MVSSFFTIAIPTYNRCEMLHRTVSRVLGQGFQDFELLISDNASSDDTEAVAKSFRDPRVRYIRQPENIGAIRNWKALSEEASGEWIVFHQDDDYLSKRFLSRCFSAVSGCANASVYLSALVGSHSPEVLYKPDWFGMPTPLDWMGDGEPSRIRGELLYPISLFMTVGFSPAAAFRRSALANCWTPWCDDCFLFAERLILVELAAFGDVIVDPWIGGVYISHDSQQSVINGKNYQSNWKVMVDRLAALETQFSADWESQFEKLLAELPPAVVSGWCWLAGQWVHDHPFLQRVRALLEPYQERLASPISRPPLHRRLLGRVQRAAQVLYRGY